MRQLGPGKRPSQLTFEVPSVNRFYAPVGAAEKMEPMAILLALKPPSAALLRPSCGDDAVSRPKPLLKKLKAGRAPSVLHDLRTLVKRLRKNKRQTVASELKYLESHRERMDYAAARRAGEPQGSGAMESTCRQYPCRFKRPGQFWSCVGDEGLMGLETFWRNDRWHLLFPHILYGNPRRN